MGLGERCKLPQRGKICILDALIAQKMAKMRLVAANALSIWDPWGEGLSPQSPRPGYAYMYC